MSGYNNEQPQQQPAYLTGMGLNQPPFASGYKPEFIYFDQERIKFNNTILQLVQHNRLLMIITGEHGVGKTSLLKHFTQSAGEEYSICEAQANTMMDAHQLLAEIAHGFGLQVANQPAQVLQETLYKYLVTIQNNGKSPVLVIDDAHELHKDALQALFTLADAETGNGNLLRIILFCEPQIEIMLDSPSIKPLRERITHTLNIPPFNEEQTAEYIKHRLAVSGFTGTSPFQPRDIKKIFEVSRGVPARINELADMHLSGENYSIPDPEQLPEEFTQLSFNKKRIAAGVVVVAVVIITILIPGSDDSPPVQNQHIEIMDAETTSIIKPVSKTEAVKTNEQEAHPQEETASQSNTEHVEAAAPLAQPAIEEVTPAKPVTARIRSTLPNPVVGSREKQSILVNGDGFSEDTRVIVSWPGNKKKLTRSQVTYENRNQLRIHITVGTKADKWSLQTDDPVYGKSDVHEFNVSAAPVTGLQTVAWINQQNPSEYTLQLLGTYNKYSLTSFARQHKLEQNTAYFATKRNGGTWYTLVHGHFETRDSARQAINTLPASLQKTKPWIRSFEGIQSITNTAAKPSITNSEAETGQAVPDNTPPQSLDLTAHAAWLWSQNPEHFTIQLLGSYNLDALHSFIKKHHLENQANFYRTRRNGKQWFVLLQGSFTDSKKARAAIEKLPADIRKTSPWPRRFVDIHGELSSQ